MNSWNVNSLVREATHPRILGTLMTVWSVLTIYLRWPFLPHFKLQWMINYNTICVLATNKLVWACVQFLSILTESIIYITNIRLLPVHSYGIKLTPSMSRPQEILVLLSSSRKISKHAATDSTPPIHPSAYCTYISFTGKNYSSQQFFPFLIHLTSEILNLSSLPTPLVKRSYVHAISANFL